MTAVLLQAPPSDSLRAVIRDVLAAREYEWRRPRSGLRWLQEAFLDLVDWLEMLRVTHPVAYYLVLAAAIVLLAAFFVHVGYIIRRAMRPPAGGPGGAPAAAPARDASWHLAEARRLVGTGRYAEALAHRFVALVLELERRRALLYHAAKTPSEYVMEARLDAPARDTLRDLVRRLYRHVFGGEACSPDDWLRFDREADALVREAHVAAR